MIYFIVTTCILPKEYYIENSNTNYYIENPSDNTEIQKYIENYILNRRNQYIECITKLKNIIENIEIDDYKIIIVDNNGEQSTYLDDLGCQVYYTNNNSLEIEKGYKELQDILDCIEKYNIKDTDFIVKMTGRYLMDDNSEFMDIVKNVKNTNYECIIKYIYNNSPVEYRTEKCFTGLIGMRCKYIKLINNKQNDNDENFEVIEHKWAKVTNLIKDELIYKCKMLGIYICPGSNTYYLA